MTRAQHVFFGMGEQRKVTQALSLKTPETFLFSAKVKPAANTLCGCSANKQIYAGQVLSAFRSESSPPPPTGPTTRSGAGGGQWLIAFTALSDILLRLQVKKGLLPKCLRVFFFSIIILTAVRSTPVYLTLTSWLHHHPVAAGPVSHSSVPRYPRTNPAHTVRGHHTKETPVTSHCRPKICGFNAVANT